MTPPAARWAELKALFDAVVEQPAAAREALIAAAVRQQGLSADLLAELRSLLAHHDQAAEGGAFLAASAAAGLAESPPEVLAAARVGQRLGPWEVVRAIGAGGMGEVFEARRADGQYEGRAAVKLLKRGMDSAAVLQRFAQERQALARLSHPHIARLLDAGASADGLPYFVLEFVDGQPIDQAVAGLSLDQRLQLFLQLADAVAHAHRNLLVHRDLKPGNVLVDSQQQVKLLDFGIAKALDPLESQDGTDAPPTLGGVRPYTPHYASPEQVRGEPVSTATDIYSLGVLLYQLLTGTRPTGRHASSAAEAARSVLEETPTRPSRLSPSEAVDPQWLHTRKRLQGDLDNILLKALEKDVAQRYSSVEALALDLRAYRSGLPVSAHAPSAWYLGAKFVRRHRSSVALAGLLVLALLAGLAGTSWQWQQAERARLAERQRAEQVRAQANRLLFDYHDAILLLPGSTEVVARLLADARSYLGSLRDSAQDDAPLLRELGVAHRRLGELHYSLGRPALGDVQQSLALLRESMALLSRAQALEPQVAEHRYQLALVQAALGSTLLEQTDAPGAMALFESSAALFDALAVQAPQNKPYRVEQVRARLRLRDALAGRGSLAGRDAATLAGAELLRAAQLLQRLLQDLPDDGDVLALFATTQNARYLAEAREGRWEDGLALLRSLNPVFDTLVARYPDNMLHARDAAVNRRSQGLALGQLGRYGEALAASSDALQRMQGVAAAQPKNTTARRDVAKLQTDVGWAHLKLGQWAQALPPLQAALDSFEDLARRDPADRRVATGLALAHATLAEVQGQRGQTEAVNRHTQRAVGLAQGLAARGAVDGLRALGLVEQHSAVAWRALSVRPGDSAHRRACQAVAGSVRAWQQLQADGALRPSDAPRRQAMVREQAACAALGGG